MKFKAPLLSANAAIVGILKGFRKLYVVAFLSNMVFVLTLLRELGTKSLQVAQNF